MRAIVQRVTQASVTVDGNIISSIGKGICVLVGIGRMDAPKDVEYLIRKILNLRIFEDDDGKRWNKSVMDKKYEVLCVSQFTLEMVLKGNKPDFHGAMEPELSQVFYENFLQQMRESYSQEKVKDGVFGAMMQVHIQNDGPVTIPLESPDNLPDPKVRKPQAGCKKANKDVANETTKSDSPSSTRVSPLFSDKPQGASSES